MSEELDCIQHGSTIGPYRIVRGFKGRGGMARVFEVEVREKYRRPDLPRRLALKVAKQEHQAALVTEADFLRRFDHPNVVRVFPLAGYHRPVYAARERFPFGWGWYYAMELVTGGCLERHLTRSTTLDDFLRPPLGGERRLGLLEALGIGCQLAAALEHIHQRYVINLDVKPGNVLFRRRRLRYLRGSVPPAVLCDFGISRDLRYPRAGLLGVATPEYISPEQALEASRYRQPVDARSDIFSLGILLYEILTGEMPFENIALVCDLTYAPTPLRQLRPSIPPLLEEVVMRALAKDPAYRFQTAGEIRAALERVPKPLDWGAAARRSFVGVTATACLAACLTVGGVGLSGLVSRTPTPAPSPPPAVATTPAPTDTPAPTPSPTAAPFTPTSTAAPTSTSAPTYTPTNTPRPVTPTFTPEPGGGG